MTSQKSTEAGFPTNALHNFWWSGTQSINTVFPALALLSQLALGTLAVISIHYVLGCD